MDPAPAAPPDAGRTLAEIAAAWWDHVLDESPSMCTSLGIDRGLDRLDQDDEAGRARRAAFREQTRRRLEAVAPDALGTEERLTRTVMHRLLTEADEEERHRFFEWSLNPLFGPHLSLQELAERHPMRTPADADAFVARCRAVPAALGAWTTDLAAGLASGRVAPKVAWTRVVGQVRAFLAQPVEATPFARAAARLPATWSDTDRSRAATAIADAAGSHVRPAYERVLAFLEGPYAGKARAAVGVASIPGGETAYRFAVRRHTTTTLTPERIHEIGVEELEKNRAEMLEIARAEGFTGTLREFFDAIAKDPRFRLRTREELLDRYRAICRRMDARLPEAFRHLPRRPYEVRALEAWREQDAPAGYYYPPALDGSRPGTFYANTRDPESWPTYDMEALAFHEAVPGHHLQIALALELEQLPDVRRHAGFTAYVEGWAHYTERLADEMGLYSTPFDRVGMLAAQAWRAARLVVDTGMHALGWDRAQAIALMRDIRSGPESDVANEVDRYIIWPGQALAYKVGSRTITDLRERARRRLGARFSLAGFHDVVLRHGPLPLSLLEDLVRLWEGDETAG